MFKSRKFLSVLVCVVFILGITSGVLAGSTLKSVTAVINDAMKVVLDGSEVNAVDTDGTALKPIIYNNRTYLPLRALANALNVNVNYDASTPEVYLESKVKFTKLWEISDAAAIKNPESVAIDNKRNCIWIINHVDGNDKDPISFVSKISMDGKTVLNAKFYSGLIGVRGLKLIGDSLYISEPTQVTQINADTGTLVKIYTSPADALPAEKAKVLNDITVDSKGNIYVADSNGTGDATTGIFKIEGDKLVSWLTGADYLWQNGLVADGDKIYAAPWGISDPKTWLPTKPVTVKAIDIATKAVTDVGPVLTADPQSSLDGIEVFDADNLLVGNWWNGKIYLVNKTTGVSRIVLDEQFEGTCDIYFDQATKILYVPLGFNRGDSKGGDKIIAYKLQ